MQNSADISREKIGNLVEQVLYKLNITQEELAGAIGVSVGTIKNIKSGKAASFEIITRTLSFLGIPLPIPKDFQLPIEPELRRLTKEHQKKKKITDSQRLLDKKPILIIAITDHLIPDGYLQEPKLTGRLVAILEQEYGIITTSPILSKELKKAINMGRIFIVDDKDKKFRYQQVK